MTILQISAVREALVMLYRSVQFLENRTSFAFRDQITVDVIYTLIDTVVSAYLALSSIGGLLPQEQREMVMRECCVFACVLQAV